VVCSTEARKHRAPSSRITGLSSAPSPGRSGRSWRELADLITPVTASNAPL